MKICILTQTFPRYKGDNAAPFMAGLAQGLANANNQVFVLTPYTPLLEIKNRGSYKIVSYKYIIPDSLHKLGYSQSLKNDLQLKPIVYLLAPFMYFFGTLALIRLVKKEKIDIINVHWILPNGFIGGLVGFLTGIPVIPTLPGSDVLMARKNAFFRFLALLSGYWATAITSNSGGLLEDLSKIGVKIKKSKVIIYGVDPREFKPQKTNIEKLRKTLNIPDQNLVVIGVGRLVEKKGFRYFIQAIPAVVAKYKRVSFVLVGDGAERPLLHNLARKLKVENYIKFTGMIDYKTLVDYNNMADIFILPSTHDREGNLDDQSVAVVEAMACGKPIITSDLPGYRVLIEDKQNGFLVKEQDSQEISKNLIKLIKDQKLRLKMGKKSRELVLEKFSWNAIGKEYTRFFNEILLTRNK